MYTYCIQNTFDCIWQQLNVRRYINVNHIDKMHTMYGIYNVIFKQQICFITVFYDIQQIITTSELLLKSWTLQFNIGLQME
jgi:hypothetical protein